MKLNFLHVRGSLFCHSCGRLNRQHEHSWRARERERDSAAKEIHTSRKILNFCEMRKSYWGQKRSMKHSISSVLAHTPERVGGLSMSRAPPSLAQHLHDVIFPYAKFKYLGRRVYDHATSRGVRHWKRQALRLAVDPTRLGSQL